MITLPPKFKKHSEYLGRTIYKRIKGTGTHGGLWMVDSVLYKSLAAAKSATEFYHLQTN